MTITRNRAILPFVIIIAMLAPLFYTIWSANATSSFDNNYRTTDEITITDYNPACAPTSLNNNWLSYFLSASTSQTHFISQVNLDLGKASLQNAIKNLGAWGVSVESQGVAPNNYETVKVFWAETGVPSVSFQGTSTILTQENNSNRLSYFQYIVKRLHDGSGGCFAEIINLNLKNTSSTNFSDVANTGLNTRNVFLGGTYNVNYPIGYDGLPIRQTYQPPRTVYPQFSYIGEVLSVRADYLFNVSLEEPKTANVRWRFVGKDNNGNYTQVLDDKTLLMYENYQYTNANYGDFELWLDIIPTSPTIVTPPDNVATTVQRIILDGNITAGNTSTNQCINGVCEPPSVYEDCGLTDVACTLRNFGIFLKSLFFTLFVPSASFMSTYFSNLSTFFNTKLGILIYPIGFIANTITEIADRATSTQCVYNTGGTFFGASPQVDLCAMETISPVFWNAFVLFARGSILFGMVFALRRKLISVLRGSKE